MIHDAEMMSLNGSTLGTSLLIDLFKNLKAGIFGGGHMPHHLAYNTVIDGGYCIDAPELLPAGASRWYQVDDEMGFPEQVTTERP